MMAYLSGNNNDFAEFMLQMLKNPARCYGAPGIV